MDTSPKINNDENLVLPSRDIDSFRKLFKEKNNLLNSGNLNQGDKAELEMWLLFSSLKPIAISKGAYPITFKNGVTRKPDVIVIFEECIFVIESKEGKSHIVSNSIAKLSMHKIEYQNSLKSIFKINHNNFVFINYFSDKELSETDFLIARQKKIILLSSKHKEFYFSLLKKLKTKAKEIIFSDLLIGKKWVDVEKTQININVLKTKIGNKDVYSFLTTPKILKKICYVHRRNMQFSLTDEETSYQRIIDPNRIKDINIFIENGGFFPTSVLLSFDKDIPYNRGPKIKSEISSKNIEYGHLSIPKEYGYAWIIDGQHRIYGYSGLDKKSEESCISVIAFKKLDQKEQADLYVDINQNQKKIDRIDIWDLYTQIEDPISENYIISWLVKKLNNEQIYIHDKIYIPSLSKSAKKYYPININNLATAIKKSKNTLKEICYDPKTKIIDKELLLTIYKNFFLFLNQNYKETFDKRLDFYLSNNGIAILIYLLNYFYEYLLKRGVGWNTKSNIKLLLTYLEDFTEEIVKTINSIPVDILDAYKRQSSESSRKTATDELIEKISKRNEIFRKIHAIPYLKNTQEDINHEFKETIVYDKNNNSFDNRLVIETVLKTVCAFINAKVEGHLYLGVDDSGNPVGLKKDLENFNNNRDKLIRYIYDQVREKFIFKDYSADLIKCGQFNENPFILEIKNILPDDEEMEPVSLIKDKNSPIIYIRRGPESVDITKSYQFEITDKIKINNMKDIVIQCYQNITKK